MKELKKLGKEELYSLLVELSSLRKENADFLKLKLQSGADRDKKILTSSECQKCKSSEIFEDF